MQAPFVPTTEKIESWRTFTSEDPLKILFGSCLLGEKCLTDGTGFDDVPFVKVLLGFSNVTHIHFCPENFSIGTPRGMPDIHGGNGFDVLDGKARVLDEKGEDLTENMIRSANKILEIATSQKIDLAILPDVSASCGSQVISDGCRLVENRKYLKGPGVSAGILIRNKIPVISHRDFKTMELIKKKLDPSYIVNKDAIDHHESDWYREYFQ